MCQTLAAVGTIHEDYRSIIYLSTFNFHRTIRQSKIDRIEYDIIEKHIMLKYVLYKLSCNIIDYKIYIPQIYFVIYSIIIINGNIYHDVSFHLSPVTTVAP